ncbi:MAG: 3-isopropylmalate dehydrogenase [Chloroflexi bacterium]|nr:3-isopropylmalate dehydrogenase [Chloroflexota bacterium]
MKFTIGIIPGDGIGREVVPAAVTVLQAVGRRYGHQFDLRHGLLAGAAMDQGLPPMPQETLDMCRGCDAVLFGAAGDPKYDVPGAKVLPNVALGQMRSALKVNVNLRPARYFPALANRTPFKPEVLKDVDLLVVRFFVGFFRGELKPRQSKEWQNSRGRHAFDRIVADEKDIRRSFKFAFTMAQSRRGKLTFASPRTRFRTSKLWGDIAKEMAPDYPGVKLELMPPDNCAMQLVRNPASFDVIVNEMTSVAGMFNNMAAMLMGSVGMAPSAAIRPESIKGVSRDGALQWGFGLYEPIHGSAPIHAGKNEANPIATVFCVAMMLRHSLGLEKEAASVDRAIDKVLKTHRTYDLMEPGKTQVGTKEMGELIARAVT